MTAGINIYWIFLDAGTVLSTSQHKSFNPHINSEGGNCHEFCFTDGEAKALGGEPGLNTPALVRGPRPTVVLSCSPGCTILLSFPFHPPIMVSKISFILWGTSGKPSPSSALSFLVCELKGLDWIVFRAFHNTLIFSPLSVCNYFIHLFSSLLSSQTVSEPWGTASYSFCSPLSPQSLALCPALSRPLTNICGWIKKLHDSPQFSQNKLLCCLPGLSSFLRLWGCLPPSLSPPRASNSGPPSGLHFSGFDIIFSTLPAAAGCLCQLSITIALPPRPQAQDSLGWGKTLLLFPSPGQS